MAAICQCQWPSASTRNLLFFTIPRILPSRKAKVSDAIDVNVIRSPMHVMGNHMKDMLVPITNTVLGINDIIFMMEKTFRVERLIAVIAR
jgi:hypothetical protein